MNIVERFTAFVISVVGNFVNGIDVSKWQGLMDWAKAKAAGAVFAFIRAGSVDNISGIPYTDFQFERNSLLARLYIKFIGFYWYFRPNHDPVKQAKYFANLIRDVYWTLPPVVDVEDAGGLSPDGVRAALKLFIKTLKEELGIKFVIVYTRQSVWDSAVAPDDVFKMMPLWAARYHSLLTSPWSDGKFVFRDWLFWFFWQWAADGNGQGAKYGAESDSIDLNRFNGDMAALEQFVVTYGRPIIEPEPPPPPPPPPDDLLARVASLEAEVSVLSTNHAHASQDIISLQAAVAKLEDAVMSLGGVNSKQDDAIYKLLEMVEYINDRLDAAGKAMLQ